MEKRKCIVPYGYDEIAVVESPTDFDKLDTKNLQATYEIVLKNLLFLELDKNSPNHIFYEDLIYTLTYLQGYLAERIGKSEIDNIDKKIEDEIFLIFKESYKQKIEEVYEEIKKIAK